MIPHEEVTVGHLENKTKFKVSNNTSETSSVHQNGIGNMNTPSEQNTANPSDIVILELNITASKEQCHKSAGSHVDNTL